MKPAGDKKFRYDIVPTYGAGTILVRNRLMLGRDAQKELFRPTEPEPSNETPTSSNGKSGESETTTEPAIDSAHHRIHPLACVSLHEHVYMPKYGVNGKEEYVRDWLKYVDWNTIASS
jgi:Fe-Mn family superoxide dismutase